MIAAITEWIRGIIFVVLFAAFLDLLLPNSSMQKFVRVIMGLFIMLSVLNPVLNFLETNQNNTELPAVTLKAPDASSALAQKTLLRREQLTREYYVKDLARQIRATVLAVEGVNDAQVTVRLKENVTTPLPQIARLEVLVAKTSLDPAAETKIKRVIAEFYQINSELIEIGVL
ncbi:MAG: stage III sporulation protein AF [Sporomusaceae bacterium]|jgi:stage III sporulation protein AF|nr:stage III sporulation protein AF [Sporomusaceae bacterium]